MEPLDQLNYSVNLNVYVTHAQHISVVVVVVFFSFFFSSFFSNFVFWCQNDTNYDRYGVTKFTMEFNQYLFEILFFFFCSLHLGVVVATAVASSSINFFLLNACVTLRDKIIIKKKQVIDRNSDYEKAKKKKMSRREEKRPVISVLVLKTS